MSELLKRLRCAGWRSGFSLVAGLLVLSFSSSTLPGQFQGGDPGPRSGPLPYAPGEKAEYQVRLGGIGVGNGSIEVSGMEIVDGHQTYRAKLEVHGGIPLARVNDRLESWIDVQGLFSRRFEEDKHEVRYKRQRIYDISPETRSYRIRQSGEVKSMPTDRPLDDVSFIFYARTLPLQVGDSYTIPRYFKEDGNPVVIKVLRKQTIRVPAGTFETIVVQPVIKTDGLFGQGGRAEIFFTDDDRRILVHMTSRVPIVGSLSLHLRSYTPGTPTAAASR